MPVAMKCVRGKIRTVEADTGKIAKTHLGHAIDGGGWPCNKQGRGTAHRQVQHINEATKGAKQ